MFDPDDPERELERLTFPRQPKHDRICLTDFFRPIDSGERDVVALQGVTVGPEVTEVMAQLERDGEFAEQLFTHGLGVQSAEGLAEWLHAEVRRGLGIELDQGRRYSWGYPACPDQSEHEKVWRLLELDKIGMYLSDGFAVMPEQSTVAIIAHHPQAVYFGMKSGFIPKDKVGDELIAGTDARRRAAARDGSGGGARADRLGAGARASPPRFSPWRRHRRAACERDPHTAPEPPAPYYSTQAPVRALLVGADRRLPAHLRAAARASPRPRMAPRRLQHPLHRRHARPPAAVRVRLPARTPRPRAPTWRASTRDSLGERWRTRILDPSPPRQWSYPGVLAAHGNGFLYAIYGNVLVKLDPLTGATLARRRRCLRTRTGRAPRTTA